MLLPQQLLPSVGLPVLLQLSLLRLLHLLLALLQHPLPVDPQGLLAQLNLPALLGPLGLQTLLLLLLLVGGACVRTRLHVNILQEKEPRTKAVLSVGDINDRREENGGVLTRCCC